MADTPKDTGKIKTQSWQVGDVKVTRVVELEMAGGSKFILPDATPQEVQPIDWMQPHFATAEGKLIMSVHALVIDTALWWIPALATTKSAICRRGTTCKRRS